MRFLLAIREFEANSVDGSTRFPDMVALMKFSSVRLLTSGTGAVFSRIYAVFLTLTLWALIWGGLLSEKSPPVSMIILWPNYILLPFFLTFFIFLAGKLLSLDLELGLLARLPLAFARDFDPLYPTSNIFAIFERPRFLRISTGWSFVLAIWGLSYWLKDDPTSVLRSKACLCFRDDLWVGVPYLISRRLSRTLLCYLRLFWYFFEDVIGTIGLTLTRLATNLKFS